LSIFYILKGRHGIIKANSIHLVCITLLSIIFINFTNAQNGVPEDSISISKMRLNCPIVDTGQTGYYNKSREINYPRPGKPFYGQDAQYEDNVASYLDNGDKTVTDRNTGLMW